MIEVGVWDALAVFIVKPLPCLYDDFCCLEGL